MANSDAAFGLRPVADLSGRPYSGAIRRYDIPATDSTAVYIGGLVKLAGSATATGVPQVTGNVSAGDVVVGVVTGFAPETRSSTIYRAASTQRTVEVAVDPNALFEVQEDGALAVASIGLNAALTGFTSGSTVTGLSSIELDSDTVATTATLDVQIVEAVQRSDNTAASTNAKYYVRLNNHQYVDGTTGV